MHPFRLFDLFLAIDELHCRHFLLFEPQDANYNKHDGFESLSGGHSPCPIGYCFLSHTSLYSKAYE